MAYNPYLQNPYLQNPYSQPFYQQPVQPTLPSSNMIWVSGEQQARDYPVAAGNTVIMMDNDNPVAYKKSTDISGKVMPLEIYDLVRRNAPKEEHHQINLDEYLMRKEFDDFKVKIDDFKNEIDKKINELSEETNQEMMMIPVKKRGRKPNDEGESV